MIDSFILFLDMTSHIYLNTRTGNGDKNYATSWYVNDPRLQNINKFKITLRSVEFPHSVYPINAYNQNFHVTEDGVNTLTASPLQLPSSLYTGSSIASTMQTLLNDASTDMYTVTYDTSTKKLTITNTTGTFAFVETNNNCYEELGFGENAFDTLVSSVVSAYPINISGTQYIDLLSNLASLSYSNASTGHVLARIPIDVAFGSVVFYQNALQEDLEITNSHIDEIFVSLVDDKGNYYELPDNAHMSLVFSLTEFS